MIFQYKYKGFSQVQNTGSATQMGFSPDAGRAPTWFHGVLENRLPFREAISALHHIVVSDLRAQPRDTSDYQRWLASQQEIWLAEFLQNQQADQEELQQLRTELSDITRTQQQTMAPYYLAQREYFKHLYTKNRDWWMVLDPVISVHPDEISFECFSLDESSYGRLACSHNVFQSMGDFSCGTTNIDYSAALYQEFQKIRDYKQTELTIDPGGFSVETEAESFREVKIDLPDSWVRGFLQVSSAMTMPAAECDLHPMDLHNILFHLKRKKEKVGPRSLRFHLKVGHPISVSIDPWNTVIECPRSLYLGDKDQTIRIWGRKRLLTLERLLPVATGVRLKLLGTGMPSFWEVQMPEMTFTLGLSGWTANDWSSSANFDLLAPRAEVSADTVLRVCDQLRHDWVASASDLSQRTGVSQAQVLSSLSVATQEGKVIYDGRQQLWRSRELSAEPLPLSSLRFQNPREEAASALVSQGAVQLDTPSDVAGTKHRLLTGTVTDGSKVYKPRVVIDEDERIIDADCTCNTYQQHKLMQGPCEHILALRVAESRKT